MALQLAFKLPYSQEICDWHMRGQYIKNLRKLSKGIFTPTIFAQLKVIHHHFPEKVFKLHSSFNIPFPIYLTWSSLSSSECEHNDCTRVETSIRWYTFMLKRFVTLYQLCVYYYKYTNKSNIHNSCWL